VELVLPWSALASDNLRKGVAGAHNREKQARYGQAIAFARQKIEEQYSLEPFAGPARLTATFYLPDNLERDPTNFIKLILDALSKRVITKDT
jgi:hypothetical protein